MKRIFIGFAIEDRFARDNLVYQANQNHTPFEFTDMSVKQPWDNAWKSRCRGRIKQCDGMIALISNNTYLAAMERVGKFRAHIKKECRSYLFTFTTLAQVGFHLNFRAREYIIGLGPLSSTSCKGYKMKQDEIGKMLFVSASEKYGDKYIEHLLEQYKIYITAAEKISDRRQKANEYFLGLNSGLVAILGFVVSKTGKEPLIAMVCLGSIAGIILCYMWYRMVRSYKGLNSAKFKVIHTIEARLPLALYDTEWEMLGRGKDKKLYWPFTHIELRVPWIFITIYTILLVSNMPWTTIGNSLCFFS